MRANNSFGYYGDSKNSLEHFYYEYNKFARYDEGSNTFKSQIEQVRSTY
jgi:hypothetical protein